MISEALDQAAVWGEHDEPGRLAVVIEPLDELTVYLGLRVRTGGMRPPRVHGRIELIDRAEALARGLRHADDLIG